MIELLVVILLVAMLAVMAIPAMRTARDDRLAFDYARQYEQVLHRASIRAAARGAAHLVVIESSNRGRIRLFEAVDGSAPPLGPRPVGSCKGATQWVGVDSWAPPAANPPRAQIIEGVELNTTGVNVDMNLGTIVSVAGAAEAAVVLCYSPGGNLFMGRGGNTTGAISNMLLAAPFTGDLQVSIMRRDVANNPRGLVRNVVVAGGAAPRIQTQ